MSDTILWSPDDPCHTHGESRSAPFADTTFIRDLGMDRLIRMKNPRIGGVEADLSSFFSTDVATLRLRAAMFTELLERPALYEALKKTFVRLSDIYALQDARDGATGDRYSEEKLLYSIRELEDYLACLDGIKAIFAGEDRPVESELLLGLWHAVEPLVAEPMYGELCAAAAKESHAIQNIRSVTVGINLDPTLRPVEAGVIAINDQSFVSGDAISHLLRMNFKKDAYTCMAPLTPTARKFTPQETAAMRESVNAALRKIFGDSLRSWAGTIKSHVTDDLRALAPLAAEWAFIEAAMDALLCLKRKGASLTPPCIIENGEESIRGLYHPLLALNTDHTSPIVRNDLVFDASGRLYILTGPNSGGKSIYLQAVGLAYAMLHLGLPIPADSAVMVPTDAILSHFADVRDGSYRQGRLGAECKRIHEINCHVTHRSLILFDEALSGTNAAEAVVISTEILSAYAEIGVRGIWVTHLHDLCRLSDTLAPTLPSRIANLSAQLDETSHNRLFTVIRHTGTPQSYAMDIARSFRLTCEEILQAARYD